MRVGEEALYIGENVDINLSFHLSLFWSVFKDTYYMHSSPCLSLYLYQLINKIYNCLAQMYHLSVRSLLQVMSLPGKLLAHRLSWALMQEGFNKWPGRYAHHIILVIVGFTLSKINSMCIKLTLLSHV